jgi:predicted PhzF superfamily epimerase YddE/YHI9
MSVSLTWVDAFTDALFAGNPAGVCLLDEPRPASTMQSLAAELGIAETAFVIPSPRPDLAAIAATGSKALLLTAAADPGSGADYVLRVFGPNVGIDEDPATGSAQCVAGPYWSAVLGRSEMVARQLSPRGAVLHVRPDGERVHIGGNAVTVFTGHLC